MRDVELQKNNNLFSADKPSFEYELIHSNGGLIAGLDEAGRGSLAGPLYVGFVIFPVCIYSSIPEELFLINDSKKITPKKRTEIYKLIKLSALHYDFESADHIEVDALNINGATHAAVERLLNRNPHTLDAALLDGNFSFKTKHNLISLKKGDNLSVSIAAASIVAKVERDKLMCKAAKLYPGYSFESNMGYGTQVHRDAIRDKGGSPIHRKTYQPYKSLICE